jgi:hypothetical protein
MIKLKNIIKIFFNFIKSLLFQFIYRNEYTIFSAINSIRDGFKTKINTRNTLPSILGFIVYGLIIWFLFYWIPKPFNQMNSFELWMVDFSGMRFLPGYPIFFVIFICFVISYFFAINKVQPLFKGVGLILNLTHTHAAVLILLFLLGFKINDAFKLKGILMLFLYFFIFIKLHNFILALHTKKITVKRSYEGLEEPIIKEYYLLLSLAPKSFIYRNGYRNTETKYDPITTMYIWQNKPDWLKKQNLLDNPFDKNILIPFRVLTCINKKIYYFNAFIIITFISIYIFYILYNI